MAISPRADVSRFTGRIAYNYAYAQAYYLQRQKNLLKAQLANLYYPQLNEEQIYNFIIKLLEGMAEDLNKEFDKRQQEILSNELKNVRGESYKTARGKFRKMTRGDLYKLAQHFNISEADMMKAFPPKDKNGRYGSAGQSVYSALGFIKEQVIKAAASRGIEKAKEYKDDIIASFENMLISSATAIGQARTTTNTASRTMHNGQGQYLGVDYGSSNILNNPDITEVPLNLYADLSYDNSSYSNTMHNIQSNNLEDFLEDYLTDPTLISTWGIQIKNFSENKQTIAYREYGKLQKDLNKWYKSGDPPRGGSFTWNATYAYYYMLAKVSDNLIAALGPATVGVLFNDKFYTMSDFIANHMFRFALTGEKRTGADYTSELRSNLDLEIHPYISQSTLYADKKRTALTNFATAGITRQRLMGGGKTKKGKLKKLYYQLEVGYSEDKTWI